MATNAFVGFVLGVISAIFSVVLGQFFLGLANNNGGTIVSIVIILLALIYSAIAVVAGCLFDRVASYLRQRKGMDV